MAGDDPNAVSAPQDAVAVEASQNLSVEVAQITYPGADRVDQPDPPENTTKDGPLGAFIASQATSPSRHFPEIVEMDKQWMEPYQKLSDMDGHKLCDAYDDAIENVIKEHGKLPEDERTRVEPMVNDTVWNGKVTPETAEALAQHPELLKSLEAVAKLREDAPHLEALGLRETTRRALRDAIYAREATADVLLQMNSPGRQTPDGQSFPDASKAIAAEAEVLKQYRKR
jgi:hypothetical protein